MEKKIFKIIVPIMLLVLAVVLAWGVWGQGETYTIQVTVPAGTRMNSFISRISSIQMKKYHHRKTAWN